MIYTFLQMETSDFIIDSWCHILANLRNHFEWWKQSLIDVITLDWPRAFNIQCYTIASLHSDEYLLRNVAVCHSVTDFNSSDRFTLTNMYSTHTSWFLLLCSNITALSNTCKNWQSSIGSLRSKEFVLRPGWRSPVALFQTLHLSRCGCDLSGYYKMVRCFILH